MERMYNDYYLIKRIEEEESAIAYASVMDSFTYKGEVVEIPINIKLETPDLSRPQIGDKVQFLKGASEDMGDELKAVKFEDIIRKI